MITALFFLVAQTQYDHGNPTAQEQLVLEMINRARANPSAEEARLLATYPPGTPGGLPFGWTISEGLPVSPAVIAKPPLAFNASLITAARSHSQDMYTNNYFDHFYPVPPATPTSTPTSRMTAAGYVFSGTWYNGENIATGTPSTFYTAARLEDDLMIDAGVAGRGHRANLLDVSSSPPYREIGVGHVAYSVDNLQGWQTFLTQDFARVNTSGPFLVGVVYWDKNSNGIYDPGEGLGGVTITLSGAPGILYYAVTSSSGGYAIPVPTTGTVTVTAAGFNLPSTQVQGGIVLGSENVKVDVAITATDTGATGIPDFWRARFPTATVPAADTDGDTYTNLAEFLGGSDPTSIASIPVQPPSPPPPPPPSSSSSGGGKKKLCGVTGLEPLLLLSLLALARRRSRRERDDPSR